MSRQAARKKSRNRSRIRKLSPLAGVLAAGLSLPLFVGAQSVPYPTYVTGPQPNGSWVVGNGQVLTPAGTQVDLGIRVRAKAIALNPSVRNHTAAVLTLGASEPSRFSTPILAQSSRTTYRLGTIRAAATVA